MPASMSAFVIFYFIIHTDNILHKNFIREICLKDYIGHHYAYNVHINTNSIQKNTSNYVNKNIFFHIE